MDFSVVEGVVHGLIYVLYKCLSLLQGPSHSICKSLYLMNHCKAINNIVFCCLGNCLHNSNHKNSINHKFWKSGSVCEHILTLLKYTDSPFIIEAGWFLSFFNN